MRIARDSREKDKMEGNGDGCIDREMPREGMDWRRKVMHGH
jgi:hypothetical protein